jgi:hypothetical protein
MKTIVKFLGIGLCIISSVVFAVCGSPEDEKTLALMREQFVLPPQGGELLKITPQGENDLLVQIGKNSYVLGKSSLTKLTQLITDKVPCLKDGMSIRQGTTIRCFQGIAWSVKGLDLKIPADFPFYFEEINEAQDVYVPDCSKDKSGNCGKKLAIIVHEPHFDIYGQHKLFLGLKSLVGANQLDKANTAFLMEAVDAKEKIELPSLGKLSLEELLERAKTQVKEPWMFYRMLDFNIINAPMLLNLTSNLNIPMPGIEDIKVFHANKYPRDFSFADGPVYELSTEVKPEIDRYLSDPNYTEEQLGEQLKKLLKPEFFSNFVNELKEYKKLSPDERKGIEKERQQLAEMERKHQELIDALQNTESQEMTPSSREDVAQLLKLTIEIKGKRKNLEKFSDIFSIQDATLSPSLTAEYAKFYKLADERDTIMQGNISTFLANDKNRYRYNFIFIGNAHEKAVVKTLKSTNTGYVILRPIRYDLQVNPYRIVEEPQEYVNDVIKNFKTADYFRLLGETLKALPTSTESFEKPEELDFFKYLYQTLLKNAQFELVKGQPAAVTIELDKGQPKKFIIDRDQVKKRDILPILFWLDSKRLEDPSNIPSKGVFSSFEVKKESKDSVDSLTIFSGGEIARELFFWNIQGGLKPENTTAVSLGNMTAVTSRNNTEIYLQENILYREIKLEQSSTKTCEVILPTSTEVSLLEMSTTRH